MKDLIILVADATIKSLLDGLLPRLRETEGIQEFSCDIFPHQYRDPGIRTGSHDFLRPFVNKYRFALVVFDYEGCGEIYKSSNDLAADMEILLAKNGWQTNRAAVICINPELENWIWVNKTRMQELIDWDKDDDVYEWLEKNGWKFNAQKSKPLRPKEAFEALLKESNIPHSGSLYQKLASKASYKKCNDTAFLKMIEQLKIWFSFLQ